MHLLRATFELFFPDECPGCLEPRGLESGTALCESCRRALPSGLQRLAIQDPLSSGWALGPYAGPLGAMVRRGKYRPDPWLVAELARRLSDAAFDANLPQVDIVSWVPVPRARLHTRGFDQSRVLATRVGRRLGLPVAHLLKRVDPRAQAARADRERLTAIRNAYRLRRIVPRGRVLLVDDVVTTGATARVCADELLVGGADQVHLLCVAARDI